MKTKTIVFLLALLLIVFAGCNNAPSNEDETQPFSFSESVQSTSESEAPAGKESKEVETTPEAVQESEPEKQEETTETDTVSSEQPQTVSESGQAAQSAEQPARPTSLPPSNAPTARTSSSFRPSHSALLHCGR